MVSNATILTHLRLLHARLGLVEFKSDNKTVARRERETVSAGLHGGLITGGVAGGLVGRKYGERQGLSLIKSSSSGDPLAGMLAINLEMTQWHKSR
jgi:hypothetical protein